jgi:hypothetical protein
MSSCWWGNGWWDDDDDPAKGAIVRAVPLNLVTFRMAKAQLNVDHDLDDDLIDGIRTRASGTVIDYCKIDIGETAFNWVDLLGEPIADNVPPEVVAATLLTIGALYENRDGDVFRSPFPLSQPVMDLLWRHRDPAMA